MRGRIGSRRRSSFAQVFIGFLHGDGPTVAYKEGFLRVVDELEPEHIAVLTIVHRESAGESEYAGSEHIAKELDIPEGRAIAYGVQLIRFGLVRDHGVGRWGYKPGRFTITDYGSEFCVHLENGGHHLRGSTATRPKAGKPTS